MDGILIIDKPVGLTSHDIVARVRRMLKEKRVGHTGTLDPFATGVLVLLIGKATRLAQFLNDATKEYEGTIRFGYATDTGDSTGSIRAETLAQSTSQEFSKGWDKHILDASFESLRGNIQQVPPMYSAKKVGGKKLYEFARRGEEIERRAVNIIVHEFEVKDAESNGIRHNSNGTCDLDIRVVCSSGTYIRALAESLGERLGVAAHLHALRRTRAGDFQIKEARTIEEIDEFVSSGTMVESLLVPLRSALPKIPITLLPANSVRLVLHGASIHSIEPWVDGEVVQLCDQAGELVALGVYDKQEKCLRPRVVLAEAG